MTRFYLYLVFVTIIQGCHMEIPNAPVANFEAKDEGQGTFTFTSRSVDANSMDWDFGDASGIKSTNEETIQHTYKVSGKYTVKLIAKGDAGSSGKSQEINAKVTDPPKAPDAKFEVTATNEQTAPCVVTFKNKSTGIIHSYEWKVDGTVFSVKKDTSWKFDLAKTYKISMKVTGPGGNDTENMDLIIKAESVKTPVAGFTVTNSGSVASVPSTFINASTNADSYFWNFGDGDTSTVAVPSHTYANPGVYNVILVATGAGGTSQTTGEVIVLAPCRLTKFHSGNSIASSITTYQYNDRDIMTSSRDQSNQNQFVNTLARTFDGNLLKKDIQKGVRENNSADIDGTVEYQYNSDGLLAKSIRNFTRVQTKYQPGDRGTTTYEYHSNHVISKITSADSTVYTYSRAGKLTGISYLGMAVIRKFKFDGLTYIITNYSISNGRINKISYIDEGSSSANFSTRELFYDDKDRLYHDDFEDPQRGKSMKQYYSYENGINPSYMQSRLKGHPFYAQTGFGNTANTIKSYSRTVTNAPNSNNTTDTYEYNYNGNNLPIKITKNGSPNDYSYICR